MPNLKRFEDLIQILNKEKDENKDQIKQINVYGPRNIGKTMLII